MLKDDSDFHASVFILRPNRKVILMRTHRPGQEPGPWKYPGGKKKRRKDFLRARRDERPAETVAREVPEETGLRVNRKRLKFTQTIRKEGYNKHFFFYRSYSTKLPRSLSDEYEETREFALEEIDALENFHPDYRANYVSIIRPKLVELGLVS